MIILYFEVDEFFHEMSRHRRPNDCHSYYTFYAFIKYIIFILRESCQYEWQQTLLSSDFVGN